LEFLKELKYKIEVPEEIIENASYLFTRAYHKSLYVKELKREILSINKNKLKKEVKERKKNVVAIRFSDGEIQAFLRKISERNSEKNQISPDKPMSEQKLEVPRCATKK
jgi:hypothetical protein